jgi:hypothetical protein
MTWSWWWVGIPAYWIGIAALLVFGLSLTKPPEQPPSKPRVVAAPGLLKRKLTVVRRDGESDERYQSRRELFGLLRNHAKRDAG